jgi:acyl-CoA reductase-like NAD-dependent aldehyde dehydrogenase
MDTFLKAKILAEAERRASAVEQLIEARKYDHVPNPFGDGPIGSTASGKLIQPYDHEHYGPVHDAHETGHAAAVKALGQHHGGWSAQDHQEASARHRMMAGEANNHHEVFSSIQHSDLDQDDPDTPSKEDFEQQKGDMLGKCKEMADHHDRLAKVHGSAGKKS